MHQNPRIQPQQNSKEMKRLVIIMKVCYYPILFQMASPQRPALVSTVGTDDTSLSESMYRSIMYTHTHT